MHSHLPFHPGLITEINSMWRGRRNLFGSHYFLMSSVWCWARIFTLCTAAFYYRSLTFELNTVLRGFIVLQVNYKLVKKKKYYEQLRSEVYIRDMDVMAILGFYSDFFKLFFS